MAYFAQLDGNNEVVGVYIVADDNCQGETFSEREQLGQQFCNSEFGAGRYVMTSKSHEFRQRYAGRGMFYDETLDVFLYAQPYASWVLNDDYAWEAPVAEPSEGGPYEWNEGTQTWDQIPNEEPAP